MKIEIKKVYADLAYRLTKTNQHLIPKGVELIHRGRKDMTAPVKKALKRRKSIGPVIGHVKQDHGMNRKYLKGAMGDALHAVLCCCGYNSKWLLRRIGAKGLRSLLISFLNESYRWQISEVFKKQTLEAQSITEAGRSKLFADSITANNCSQTLVLNFACSTFYKWVQRSRQKINRQLINPLMLFNQALSSL